MRAIVVYSWRIALGLLCMTCCSSGKQELYQQTLTPLMVTMHPISVARQDTVTLVVLDDLGGLDSFYMVTSHEYLLEVVSDTLCDYPYIPSTDVFLYLDTTHLQQEYIRSLYWVNNSATQTQAMRLDNHLNGRAEVKWNGVWQPIHRYPDVYCGSSIGVATLMPHRYCQFEVPVYNGPLKVLMRYMLQTGDTVLYSNTIQTTIHPHQVLKRKSFLDR